MSIVPYESSSDLRLPHGFFGRKGGVSQKSLASLNVAVTREPYPHVAAENRRRIARCFGLGPEDSVTATQEHGAHIMVVAAQQAHAAPQSTADGLLTYDPGIMVGVMTADCVPILLTGKAAQRGDFVAALHVGWRGFAKGIIDVSLKEILVQHQINPATVRAAIGPAIQQAHYEVGVDVADKVADKIDPKQKDLLLKPAGKPDRECFLFDLPGAVEQALRALGLAGVYNLGLDTYSAPQDYFSCRRAYHEGEPTFGNQLSVIMRSAAVER